MKFRKIIAVVLCTLLCMAAFGCSAGESKEAKKLTIAYQGGIGYAPIHIIEAKELIQKYYDGDVEVEFQQLDSGAAINEVIIGGNIDIGCMGVAVAVAGVANGIPYKVMSNLYSSQNGLMTNDPDIKTLADIESDDLIALINTGSIQHILLAMACEKELGDAHALDNNISPMAHADGMAALESGTVTLHLTASPFLDQERENENYHELTEVAEVWPKGNSFLVAAASTALYEEDPKLYEAVCAALDEAIAFLNEDKDAAAEIEKDVLELDKEKVLEYLNQEGSLFTANVTGAGDMVEFMYRAEFINKEISVSDLLYDNCSGN